MFVYFIIGYAEVEDVPRSSLLLFTIIIEPLLIQRKIDLNCWRFSLCCGKSWSGWVVYFLPPPSSPCCCFIILLLTNKPLALFIVHTLCALYGVLTKAQQIVWASCQKQTTLSADT